MRRLHILLMAMMLGLVLLAPPPARATEPATTLGGVNVLEGDASGYLRVHLPESVAIDSAFAPNQSVSVSGAGSLHGLVLRQIGPNRVNEALIAAGRFNPAIFCDATCTKPVEGISVVSAQPLTAGNAFLIPAGDYHLHLVTDGPARVTLRLPELDGERHLSPTVQTAARVAALPLRTPVDAANVRAHGGSG